MKDVLFLCLFFVLVASAAAQSGSLQGEWRSSDGGRLVVGETGSDGTFSIGVYSPDGKHYHKRVARWDVENDSRFHYRTEDEDVLGTYFPEDRKLQLREATGTWTTLWYRSSK